MTSPPPTLRAWLREGPFTLTLSAGFFGFFAHAGFIAVLEEEGLTPERLTGSSAGALVAGLWASGRDAATLREALFSLRRDAFWDPGFGAGLLKGQLFAERLAELLPVDHFEACRWPLALSVFELARLRTRIIDTGLLNPAIRASCAFPGLFHPVRVAGRLAIDGGVLDRSGLAAVPSGTRTLYHHLATRSRLRGKLQQLSGVPQREGLCPIVIEDLPRVGPGALEEGPRAFSIAREALLRALDAPAPVPVGSRMRGGETSGTSESSESSESSEAPSSQPTGS